MGLVLDLIATCLDVDHKKRPTVAGLLNSPIFKLDTYEMTNAVRFSQNVILYRSPQSSVSMRITEPLRRICADAISSPLSLFEREESILQLFAYTEDSITHITSMPVEEINAVLTESEKRKGLVGNALSTTFKTKDWSQLRVSPNSPLATTVIDDRVIDMLLFLTFRYMKYFNTWKAKRVAELQSYIDTYQNDAGGDVNDAKSMRSRTT